MAETMQKQTQEGFQCVGYGTYLGGGSCCPVVPPGGADESMSSTGEVHTGLLEANSIAYCRTSARGNLLGPEP